MCDGMAFGICSPSGSPLYVCACMCLCTAVGMCSPSGIPFVVSICMRACTAFGTYGSSGVLIAQKCACVGLHSARRVPAKFGCCVSFLVNLLHVSGAERAHRTCTGTVFGMDHLISAPTARECACVGVYPVHVHVQCSALEA